MTQHGSIVYLEGVSVTFDGFQALRGVNLYVDHGELRALIGPNGAVTLSLPQRWNLWSTLFGAPTTAQLDKMATILETLGLHEKAHHQAGSLSHGEVQWLEIGMVMAQEPALFLLDEPVAGMTGREREKTAQLLQRMAQDRAVLVVEHDMEFVRQTAQKVTVLHEGAILCEGSVDRVQQDPRVIEVYLGRGYHADAQGSGA